MPKRKSRGQNGSGRTPSDDDDDELEFTEADRAAIGEIVTETVNAAVTAQITRKLPGMLTAAMKPITDRLEAIQSGGQQQGQPGAGGGQQPGQGAGGGQQQQGQPGAGGAATSPEVAALQRQLAELQAKDKQRDAELKDVAKREREGKRDAMLADHLGKAGVDKNRVRGAAAVLRDSMVWVDTANNGQGGWVYRAQRDGYHEDLDVAAGVKEWAATDEGKAYVAANPQLRGGAGTGANPGARATVGGGALPSDPKAAKATAKAQAEANLPLLVQGMMGGGTITVAGGGGGG